VFVIFLCFLVESVALLAMKRGGAHEGAGRNPKQARKGGKPDERSERPLDAYYFTDDGLRHVKPYIYGFR
jgi:hypothetical protein